MKSWIGILTGITSLVAIASVFIWRKRKRNLQ